MHQLDEAVIQCVGMGNPLVPCAIGAGTALVTGYGGNALNGSASNTSIGAVLVTAAAGCASGSAAALAAVTTGAVSLGSAAFSLVAGVIGSAAPSSANNLFVSSESSGGLGSAGDGTVPGDASAGA